MSPAEAEILSSQEAQDCVEALLGQDPVRVALQLSGKGGLGALVATQIKVLEKAKKKLPTWYKHLCILPPRAFEQCSSEASAQLKSRLWADGERALDLTGGLGVDTFALAQKYTSVTALEPDPGLRAVNSFNFTRLKADGVNWRGTTAEEFLAEYTGPPFDLVYLDPDRRDEQGKRKVLLEECSPNVLDLQDRLLEVGKQVLIKVSPLFDFREGVKLLKNLSRVVAISIEGEVKELLFELRLNQEGPVTLETVMFRKGKTYTFSLAWDSKKENTVRVSGGQPGGQWIFEPDPALYKLGLAGAFMDLLALPSGIQGDHPHGYFWGNELPETFPGRIFKVVERLPFKPKQIKKWLHSQGITRANLYHRHFGMGTSEILKKLNLKEGGDHHLLFTRFKEGSRWLFVVEREDLIPS